MEPDGCCCGRDRLTDQEVSVLELVALGLSNTEVGVRLHISGHTVAAHVSSAMRRLGARSRTDLVARSYVQEILDPLHWPPRSLGRRCVRELPSPEPWNADRPRQRTAGAETLPGQRP